MSATYFSLNRQIDANKLLKKIQELLHKHGDVSNSILKIEVIDISRDDTSMTLKLEYKH
jgi:hypothetical protein